MTALRRSALLLVATAEVLALAPHVHAQWWKRSPVDFESCADRAEKSVTAAEKTSALAECNAKFAGRRKPGGGYTYYDFLQDRSFDIAGPNPTPDEQKKIDETYTSYLADQRRNTIAQEAAARQQEQQRQEQRREPIQQVALRTETERVPVPVERPKQQQQPAVSGDARARAKNCAKSSFSCEWPRLSEGLNDLKRLLSSTPAKPAKKG